MAPLRMKDRLEQRASQEFVGRSAELQQLIGLLSPDGPVVGYLHGIGGIGKSSLLQRLASEARGRGAVVVELDGRGVEPTERGFLEELGRAIGSELDNLDSAARRLGELGDAVLLLVDTYEVLRLLDTWLRQVFVPSLSEGVCVLLSGREPPVSTWLTAPGWHGFFTAVHLKSLPEEQAIELLGHYEIDEARARRINRHAHGHPLAIKLAGAALTARPDLDLDETVGHALVDELTRVYLDDIGDRLTRESVEAVSVIRRVTHSLLRALMPEAAPMDIDARLRALPFVEAGRDGLVMHDVVRSAIASSVRSRDPARYRSLRHAAWSQLNVELELTRDADLWRYTADMLYLIENPVIREAFFPSDHQPLSVEPALPGHGASILEIAMEREGPESAGYLSRWWEGYPESFKVVRDPTGGVAGFYCAFDPTTLQLSEFSWDPVIEAFRRDLGEDPPPNGQGALIFRKWLSRTDGEAPSPVQAACWLDVKRTYLEMRRRLRRVYVAAWDVEPYADVLPGLGFRFLDSEVPVDGLVHHAAVLDFGPGLVGGWMSGIVSAELSVSDDQLLDEAARELVLNSERVPLTKLEFEVMKLLRSREGQVTGREEMLEQIWGIHHEGSSNVVDAVIRSLRKKLGPRSDSIETVRGVGYRYHPVPDA